MLRLVLTLNYDKMRRCKHVVSSTRVICVIHLPQLKLKLQVDSPGASRFKLAPTENWTLATFNSYKLE